VMLIYIYINTLIELLLSNKTYWHQDRPFRRPESLSV
jgi:hypothetical protein